MGEIEIPPHNRLLVSGSGMNEDGDYSPVQIWNLHTGARRILPRSEGVDTITFSPDGQRLIGLDSEEDTGALPFHRTWNAATGAVEHTHRLPRRTLALNFSPDDRLFATGLWDARSHEPVTIWDARTGRRLYRLRGPYHTVRDVAFSPNAPWLVTAGGEDQNRIRGELMLWDRRTGKLLASAPPLPSLITSAEFSPNGSLLASASDDGTVRLWRVH